MDRYYYQQQFFGDRGLNREQQYRNMNMNSNNHYGFYDNRNSNFNQSSNDNFYNHQTGNQLQFNRSTVNDQFMNQNSSYRFSNNQNSNNYASANDNYTNHSGNQLQFNRSIVNNHQQNRQFSSERNEMPQARQSSYDQDFDNIQNNRNFRDNRQSSANFYDDDVEPTFDFSKPNSTNLYRGGGGGNHQQIQPQQSSDKPPMHHISCSQRKIVLKKKWKIFVNATPNTKVNMKQWMKEEEKKMKIDPESARIAKNILRSQPRRRWKRSLNVKRYGDKIFYYLDSDDCSGGDKKPFVEMTRVQRKILLNRWKEYVDTSKVINNQENFMSWMPIEIEKIKKEPEPEKTPVQLRIEQKRMQRKLKRKQKLKNKLQRAQQETTNDVPSLQSDSTQSG